MNVSVVCPRIERKKINTGLSVLKVFEYEHVGADFIIHCHDAGKSAMKRMREGRKYLRILACVGHRLYFCFMIAILIDKHALTERLV